MKAIRALVVSMAIVATAACGSSPAVSASPRVSPGNVAAIVTSATPVLTPAPVPASAASAVSVLPAFQCSDQSGNGWPGSGAAQAITAVRLAAQSGYDRFVVEFTSAVPGYRVRQQAGSGTTLDPSGLPVTLDGSAAIILSMNPASTYSSYAGSRDLRAPSATLREARQVGDFEAVNTWGLGLSKAACFRAFTLASPARLVIDVQS